MRKAHPTLVNPTAGGITGLAYALAQSEHRFHVRNIDLSAEDLTDSALWRRVIAEPSTDRGDVVKLWGGGRYAQTITPMLFSRIAETSRHTGSATAPALLYYMPSLALMDCRYPGYREVNTTNVLETGLITEGVYVILGGAGTVGRVITRLLQQRYQAKVIWLGRRPESDSKLQAQLNAFATPPYYVQADANDLASLSTALQTIQQQYPHINGAMFSGIVFDFDNSIAHTSEAQFNQILTVKTQGVVNFYQTFAPLVSDFLVYFSSGQAFSFSGAAQLSAYAAGITFADSFVHAAAQLTSATPPVGAINWGFWQSSLEEWPLDYAINSLSDEQGFTALERFTALLRQGVCRQLLCLNASEPVRAMMPVPLQQQIRLADGLTQSKTGFAEAVQALAQQPKPELATILNNPDQAKLLNLLARAVLARIEVLNSASLHRDALYQRWWQQTLTMLDQAGLIHYEQPGYRLTELGQHACLNAWPTWQTEKAYFINNAETRALALLLDDCLTALPAVLTGQVPATDVLFPNGSTEKVAGIYQKNQRVDYFNAVLADSAEAFIQQRLAVNSNRPLRILEIGAGTGGTTAMVLNRLSPYYDNIEQYAYTDISKAFLHHGQQHYGQHPFMRYALLNIEQAPDTQDFVLGHYDVVIAANVLHATGDIRSVLSHAKALLNQGGVLLLNEISDTNWLSHLTFGLLKGWWLYQDAELRMSGSPGLTPNAWRQQLLSLGFRAVYFPAESAHRLGQQIIAATSDGLVTCTPQKSVATCVESVATTTIKPNTVQAQDNAAQTIQSAIKQALSEALKAPLTSLENHIPFSDYGLDSILGVGFIKQVNQVLKLNMNTAIIFDYSTIEQLTDYIVKTYPGITPTAEPDTELARRFFNGELGVGEVLDKALLSRF
ncbi:SDR family NAD(P)-dependent oxidoreductase [Methylocucumis oryzae]|uniref:Carrier domain-containing protein n=1 Tax=Methylocucumis oryzae TaxID=1632867 RepID=A0A0F3IKA2_9GAMM|nr:SDR family NAD(P)-dependent oxidoreductase [Methylocucumis oryzae]KJV07126.1 hypothetical protein VZ94_06825 [Methylocucumis oryzae]